MKASKTRSILGGLTIDGDLDLDDLKADQIMIAGPLSVSGSLINKSDVKLAVFGPLNAQNIAINGGAIHTYGSSEVLGKIEVDDDGFFMAHAPLKADIIYASSEGGFGFVRISCRFLIDTFGDDLESIDMQGYCDGEILGETEARERGLLK